MHWLSYEKNLWRWMRGMRRSEMLIVYPQEMSFQIQLPNSEKLKKRSKLKAKHRSFQN
jgi:hypothetical protein